MDLKDIDLNLLVVFDALVDARSVTVAGRNLGLSQPAMSYALGKLRHTFNDPLFVRIRNEMLPTPRAAELAAAVRSILGQVKTELLQYLDFVPAKTRRTFTLCMSDIGEMVFLPTLTRVLFEEAPEASLNAVYMDPAALVEAMEAGTVDLAMGYFPDLQNAGLYQQLLSTSGFLCVARSDNSYVKGKLTLARFLDAPHVAVHAAGRSRELFDRTMAKAGHRRSIPVTVPHFLSLLELVPRTDLIATVPTVLAEYMSRIADTKMHPLPMPSPRFAVKQFWHRRFHADPANRWIRGVVRRLFQHK
ncbi:MAG: LysR family transcriptional regulator [Rhodospirillales bacterium]|jgi:DNA-binding transcriptional LysR family regulator|nr:LysR family transcriptional regulator [Rhodospirillales bacterium]